MNKIDDIKTIRERTEYAFSLQACKYAYEAHGCNVEAAVAYLLSLVVKTENELTDTERAEIEAYKKKAEKRASKKTAYQSKGQKVAAIVYGWSALVLFVLGIVTMIIFVAGKETKDILIPMIISFVLSAFCAIAWYAAKTMKREDWNEANRVVPKEVTYREGDTLICPCCGSHEVQFFEPKFNKKKALIGTVVTGSLLGAYFGVPKDGIYKAVCNHCGHHWKAKIK